MRVLNDVAIEPQPLEALAPLCSTGGFDTFAATLHEAAKALERRTVWHVNSTAEGGGVAEMLHALLPYLAGAGWDVRWVVMTGDGPFFDVTKGLHNALHGERPADDDVWKQFDDTYLSVTDRNAADLIDRVRPGDIAIVHDPQTAGLIAPLTQAGVRVIWQCHIGTDTANDCTRAAWDKLRRFVEPADRFVFTRSDYLWSGLDASRLRVIPPAIDALSPKNAPLDDGAVERICASFNLPAGAPVVLQVSRWDRLKDPIGFIRLFADHLADASDVHAVYAGPATAAVDDDPEGRSVRLACEEVWRSLDDDVQSRMHLLSIPMDDLDANARAVNALQRRADVVVQKSLKEGFGLTVAEAMWKSRPVVGSRVGGIQDQIVDGVSGRLVDDAHDIGGFAAAVRELLDDPEMARRMGTAAHERVEEHFLGPRLLSQYAELVTELT